jgi:hypothetical protein
MGTEQDAKVEILCDFPDQINHQLFSYAAFRTIYTTTFGSVI